MLKLWLRLREDIRGISALEYAVLAAVLLVMIVAGIELLDPEGLFTSAKEAIDTAKDGATSGG